MARSVDARCTRLHLENEPARKRRTESVEVAAAEGECAKVLVNGGQQLLGAREPQRHVPHVKVLHVVAALEVLADDALA